MGEFQPKSLHVKVFPANLETWSYMRKESYNPRVKFTVHPSSKVDMISNLLEKRTNKSCPKDSAVISLYKGPQNSFCSFASTVEANCESWKYSEYSQMTFLDLYHKADQSQVLLLKYDLAANADRHSNVSNALRRLLQVVNAEHHEQSVAASKCSRTASTQTTSPSNSMKPPPPPQLGPCINPQSVHRDRRTLDALSTHVHTVDTLAANRKAAEELVAQLRAQRPAGMRGAPCSSRPRMRRPVVVKRALLPKAVNRIAGSGYTLVPLAPQHVPSHPDAAGLVQAAMDLSGIPVTQPAPGPAGEQAEQPPTSQEEAPPPPISLEDSLSSSMFRADRENSNSFLDLHDLAPSPQKPLRPNPPPESWQNGEDFSLSQYLITSPVKPPTSLSHAALLNENSRESLRYDVDNEFIAVMNEDSMQSYNKFADLASMMTDGHDKNK